MFCQIDRAGQILHTCAAARSALLGELQFEKGSLVELGLKISSIAYGLLLINDYDVLIIKGSVAINGSLQEHCWLEVYLEGDLFVLDAAFPLFVDNLVLRPQPDYKQEDIIYLPKEDTSGLYVEGKVQDWHREECTQSVWQRALDLQGIKKPLDEVCEEILSMA